LDYQALLPVIGWLIKILIKNRDDRGILNRRQGLLNYKLNAAESTKKESGQVDTAKLKQIIFNGKPKRVYKANKNKKISYQDPKRVHTCLREFNDLSASKVFQGILNQI